MDVQIPLTSRDKSSKTSIVAENSDLARDSKVAVRRLKALFRVFGTAWRDVKLISEYIRKNCSRKFWIHVALAIVLILASISSGLIVIPSSGSNQRYCDPGGNFNFAQTYNLWAREHTFQITLGFGKLTFTQAKAIDVVWDVVVGRGGQLLLTAICFHVFSRSLNLRLEQPKASISYDGFRAIVFERPTLSSTLKLVLDLRSTTGWRTKASTLWMVIASIYVVAFPTMISAMTGYSSTVKPYFDDGTGNGKIPIPESGYFHRAIYLITGADRIEGMSLNATYLVGSRGFGSGDDDPDWDYTNCLTYPDYLTSSDPGDCLLAHYMTRYISAYGAQSPQTTNITLSLSNDRNISVQSPGLTIETFNTASKPFSSYYIDESQQKQQNLTLVNITKPFLYTTTNGTRTFNETYLNNNAGTCDSQPTYLWGFSFILLFGFFVVTAVWVLGMYAMWIHTLRHSRLDRVGRTMGFYRGVVDMTNAMWKDLPREPDDLASDPKIRELLAQKLNGGRVTFDGLNRDKLPPALAHEFRRFRRGVPSLSGWTETWGLLHWTYLLSFALVGLAWFGYPLVLMTGSISSIRFFMVLSFAFAGVCWVVALSMLLAVVPGAMQMYRLVPHSDVLSRPRPLARGIWIAVSTALGGISCLSAKVLMEDSYFYFPVVLYTYMGVAGLFWTVATIMLLTGLFSTMWRWSANLVRTARRSWLGHEVISQTQENMSSRYRTVDDAEPE